MVKIAMAEYGSALQYAAESMKENPEVVKIAVAEAMRALQYAAESVKENPEVVKTAVPSDGDMQLSDLKSGS